MNTSYKELRKFIIKRDGNRCVDCEPGHETGLPVQVHHVLHRRFGGTDEPSNLITLCQAHHDARHSDLQGFYQNERTFRNYFYIFINLLKKLFGNKENLSFNFALYYLTGSKKFREKQREVIENVMNGKNTLVVMPTGKGKSLCFQIPGLLNKKTTLVITPLKTLMKDQVDFLLKKMIPSTFINSDLDKDIINERVKFIDKNLFKFVYVAPERYFNPLIEYSFTNKDLVKDISMLVVDEAHCIDIWGRNFRPAYAKLGELRSQLNNPTTIALTASASRRVQKKILSSLNMEGAEVYVTGFFRPEIDLSVEIIGTSENYKNKNDFIKDEILESGNEKVLIFVPTITRGKELYEDLKNEFEEVYFYHSKVEKSIRVEIQDRFSGLIKPEIKILIATSAFGMGVNIPNIRKVIHWSIPPNLEDYYQQAGRAGRDGQKSKAILLYEEGDEGLVRYMNQKQRETNRNNLPQHQLNELIWIEEAELRDMLSYVYAFDNWGYILQYFGEEKLLKPILNWSRLYQLLKLSLIIFLIILGMFLLYFLQT